MKNKRKVRDHAEDEDDNGKTGKNTINSGRGWPGRRTREEGWRSRQGCGWGADGGDEEEAKEEEKRDKKEEKNKIDRDPEGIARMLQGEEAKDSIG